MNDDVLGSGRLFLDREGRLIERRIAAFLFDGEPSSGVIDAVRAYRNDDGGFGHGLEPDKRCPASLPLDVECALDHLWVGAAGSAADELILRACDWLASVASPDGAVPLAFPVIERYPHAVHWSDWAYAPALNPTAGLAGRLHRVGVEHPWLTRATEWTWTKIESGVDRDAHALAEVLIFLENAPDRSRAEKVARDVPGWLATATMFHADPNSDEYGLTPLHLAPEPGSPWRSVFDDATIDGHLDRLVSEQMADGGWPITWEPPGAASLLEWRGIETLRALRTLRAYGRI